MPSRSKKRAIKRKKETANHQNPTNSSVPQGNGTSGDHDDSSDHPLTDEEISPRTSVEAEAEPEPQSHPEPEPQPHPEPEPQPHPEPEPQPEPQSHPEVEPEPHPELELEPEPQPQLAVREDASAVPIKQPAISESEQTEATTAVPLEVLQESSAPREVREKSGDGSSYSERAEIPVAVPRDIPATGPAPLLERRASWSNCCGLLDVFRGSQS